KYPCQHNDQGEQAIDQHRLIEPLRSIENDMEHGQDRAEQAKLSYEDISFCRTNQNPRHCRVVMNHSTKLQWLIRFIPTQFPLRYLCKFSTDSMPTAQNAFKRTLPSAGVSTDGVIGHTLTSYDILARPGLWNEG